MINHKKRNKAYLVALGVLTLFLLLLFTFKLGWFSNQTIEKSAVQQKRMVELPDGSFAHLNAASQISFNTDHFSDKKIVQLKGEALFTVKRGATFLVKTAYGYARGNGNSFNVYARPDGFEISCFRGQVEGIAEEEKVALNVNEKATWENNNFVTQATYSTTPGWVRGETIFKNEPFSKAIAELERQYNLKVILEITGNPPFTGGIPHNEIQTAVDNLVDPYGYQYE